MMPLVLLKAEYGERKRICLLFRILKTVRKM